MVVALPEPGARLFPLDAPWKTVSQDVMGGLDVEGLLDFGVGGEEEVDEDDEGEEEGQEGIWEAG